MSTKPVKSARPGSAKAGGHAATPAEPGNVRPGPKKSAARGVAQRLGDVVQAGAKQVGANPLAAVAGTAAVSAGIALLLPSTRREAKVMGDVADKLGDVAREAADNAVEAGRKQVENLAQTALAGVGGALVEAAISGGEKSVDDSDARLKSSTP
ncbi:hypothetical protein P1X14_00225 [Sphingomonas sp. AOB5]|uniref:hypothetical protein n=1 Tax=Sphingomonas sp. AOB5 TaxID=3034017 RepID=UPI0023F63DAF|nr:hypothetical protein [Sphingomonas sp. AOB5]MDF7773657.1 hypothetical protein [Sphingomonas sp. AOB5]